MMGARLTIIGTRVQLRLHSDADWVEEVIEGATEVEERVGALLHGAVVEGSSIALSLGHPWGQVRRLSEPPPLAGRKLAAFLRGKEDQLFRLPTGGLMVSSTLAGPAGGDRYVTAVDQEVFTGTLRALDQHSVAVDSVAVSALRSGADHSFTHPEIGRSTRRWAVRRAGFLMVAATVLWGLAGVVYLADLVSDARSAESRLGELRTAVTQLDSLRARIRTASTALGRVTRGAERNWPVSGSIATLAAELEPDHHLSVLRFHRDSSDVQIALSPRPDSAALARLNESGFRLIGEEPAPDERVAER